MESMLRKMDDTVPVKRPISTRSASARASRRASVTARKVPVARPKEAAPETLRDCLAPLAAAAIQTSVLAYTWGLANGQLMRASIVMDLAGDVVKQCNRLLEHEHSAAGVVRDVARQMAHSPAVANGGPGDVIAAPNGSFNGPGPGPATP
jgi:hypothetical protein